MGMVGCCIGEWIATRITFSFITLSLPHQTTSRTHQIRGSSLHRLSTATISPRRCTRACSERWRCWCFATSERHDLRRCGTRLRAFETDRGTARCAGDEAATWIDEGEGALWYLRRANKLDASRYPHAECCADHSLHNYITPTLHYITPHYTTLHYKTLHYITTSYRTTHYIT